MADNDNTRRSENDKTRKSENSKTRRSDNDNTVYIGNKAVMNYVLAVVTQFNNGANEVKIKARGRTISKAVDVAEIVHNRFVQNSSVGEIQIGTERLTGEQGETNVSTIEIGMNSANAKTAEN